MLSELAKFAALMNRRLITVLFSTVAITVYNRPALLDDPLSWSLLVWLPASLMMFRVGFVLWTLLILWIDDTILRHESGVHSGRYIGLVALAFCLLVALSYLGRVGNDINFTLLRNPNFIFLCAIALWALETTNIGMRPWRKAPPDRELTQLLLNLSDSIRDLPNTPEAETIHKRFRNVEKYLDSK